MRLLFVLAPFVALFLLAAARRAYRAWVQSRRLAEIDSATSAAELDALLALRDEVVVASAATKLVALAPSSEVVAKVGSLPAPAARAVARALGAREPALVLVELGRAETASRRLPWACAAAASEEGARALVALAGDEKLASDERGAALDAIEGSPKSAVRLAATSALAAGAAPTAELLWALSESGEPDDALLAARHVTTPSYPVAHAAVEAVFALLDRGEPAEGARLREVLALGRAKMRDLHPRGDNPLADDLVSGLEELEARLPQAASVEAPPR